MGYEQARYSRFERQRRTPDGRSRDAVRTNVYGRISGVSHGKVDAFTGKRGQQMRRITQQGYSWVEILPMTNEQPG